MKVYINGHLIGETIEAQFDYSATEDVARFVIPIDYGTTAIELQESREENKRLRDKLFIATSHYNESARQNKRLESEVAKLQNEVEFLTAVRKAQADLISRFNHKLVNFRLRSALEDAAELLEQEFGHGSDAAKRARAALEGKE